MEKITLKITGLDCAEEVRALRETVGKLDGIADLDFNVLKGTMSVTFAEETLDQAGIEKAVQEAGLKAQPLRSDGAEVAEGFWQRQGRKIMCSLSGLLAGGGFVTHAVLHGSVLDALAGGEGSETHLFPSVSIVLYVGAVIAGVWYVLPKAWTALRRLRPDMNLLMNIAVAGALAIGEYFEAAAVAFLFSFSLLLESWSVGRARRAIEALLDLTPQTARYVCPCDGDIMEKPVAEVPVGATVLVRPGEKIPLDGIVTKGTTSVNQAPITGESMPVDKGPDAEVFAGTINEDGAIEFRSTKPASDTTLARIVHMVEEAQERRAPSEQWVEKFARYYTPSMIVLAVLVALVPPLLGGAWGAWFYEALVILVIACPCALVISTPVSIVAALAASARAGVLVKGGIYLETAARLKAIALDKTGTITHGHPEVQDIVPLNGHSREELLERAAALEAHSNHPLARAILRLAEKEQIRVPAAEDYQTIKGKGASATIAGQPFWLGSHRFLHEKDLETPELHRRIEAMEDAGHSIVVIGNDRHVCGLISVADTIREQAAGVIKELGAAGLDRVLMLTGDNQGTAAAIGRAVGIDDVRAELLPEDKQVAIEELVRCHHKAAMVGDGINDAPALAAASLGMAMGTGGTDAAIETADIALMSDDLTRIPWLIRHAQRTLRIIRQNIFFALGLKAVFMVLALAKLATLWMAIAADMGASLLVIANGLRLLRGHRKGLADKHPYSAGCA